jgi:hypothetical protein
MVSRTVAETHCLDENTRRSDESKGRCLCQATNATHLAVLSSARAETGDRVHESKNIQQPQDHADDDDSIQDRLDGTRHGL